MLLLSSCETYNPPTKLYYASIRPTIVKDESDDPIQDASILAYYVIDYEGKVDVIIENLTDDILTIDQTKSFFVNADKQSTAYYDPTVRTTTNSYTSASGTSRAFNLGGIANAFGIGGPAGSLLRATTVGGSSGSAATTTNTTVMADMPQVSIAPRGKMALSKTFGGGLKYFGNTSSTPYNSPFTFSVLISYSFDNGNTWDQLITDFYCNDSYAIPITGRHTNDAVKRLLTMKPNATKEPWFQLLTDRSKQNHFYNFSTFINYQ